MGNTGEPINQRAARRRRTFIALIASEPHRSRIARRLSMSGILVATAYDPVTAVRLGVSPLCSVLLVIEPLEGTTIDEVVDAARLEGVRVPIVRAVDEESAPIDLRLLLIEIGRVLSEAREGRGAAGRLGGPAAGEPSGKAKLSAISG